VVSFEIITTNTPNSPLQKPIVFPNKIFVYEGSVLEADESKLIQIAPKKVTRVD
jgi:hypothetical protein